MLTYEQLKARFKIVPTGLLSLPKDLTKLQPGAALQGDCQDYGKTAKKAMGLKWYQAMQIRCWSPQNWKQFPFVPRHAVLWVFGKGFVDSTHRDLRRFPLPHLPLWPVGTGPILVVYESGIHLGLWNTPSIYNLIVGLFF